MAHKSYQSILPTHNKLLQKRWDQQRYDTHQKKLRSASSMVDSSAPRAYPHIQMKLKKQQVQEERLAVIERDNRTLLEKMSHIMRSRGRTDNGNDYEHRSLNKEKREREQLRVSSENKGILTRLQAVRPLYDRKKWEDDFLSHEEHLQLITAFPLENWPTERRTRRKSYPIYKLKEAPPRELPPLKKEEVKKKPNAAATAPAPLSKEKKAIKKVNGGKNDAGKGAKKEASSTAASNGEKSKKKSETEKKDQNATDGKVEEKVVRKVSSEGETTKEEAKTEETTTATTTTLSSKEAGTEEEEQKEKEKEEEKEQEKERAAEDKSLQKSENKKEDEVEAKDEGSSKEKPEPLSDVDADVESLKASVSETDSGKVVATLKSKTYDHRRSVASRYKELHGNELSEVLKSAFDGAVRDAVVAAVRTRAQVNAWALQEAMKGSGTDEKAVMEILYSLSNREMDDVKAAYNQMYEKDLAEQLKCETSGHFESLLMDLCKNDRNESDDVDEELAQKDAKELLEASEGRWGTDEGVFIRIIANRSRKQLQATFDEYEKVAEKTILATLEGETSGDLYLGLRTTVLLVQDPAKHWCTRIKENLEKGADGRNFIIRIVLATDESKLGALRGKYEELYSRSLADAVRDEVTGELGDMLASLVNL
ncbi:uncharacterized protein [Oscarella lobularis]|uniref:uncharacterized protein n=1 Tax=Oscarella lobularis TaxID=121494 RepID=UPI003313C7EB